MRRTSGFRSALIATLLLVPVILGEQVSAQVSNLYVVHFTTGSAWDTTKAPNEQTGFAEHSANLGRLRSDGLILFGGRYDQFGMIVLRDTTLESATSRIAADPGVRSNLFTFTISPLSVFYKWKD